MIRRSTFPPPWTGGDEPTSSQRIDRLPDSEPAKSDLVRGDPSSRSRSELASPVSSTVRRVAPAAGLEGPGSGKPRVLVVDDSLPIRMRLRTLLTEAGFSVTACETTGAARGALRMAEYALIVLDVVLPDGNGMDLLAELRGSSATARTPVILISDQADVWDRIRGMRAGADECLAKPFDEGHLTRRARELAIMRPAPPSSPGSGPMPASSDRMPPPSADPRSAPSSSRVLPIEKPRAPRILLVEDNAPYRRKLSAMLITGGHDVAFAPSAEQGLDMLTSEIFDAVVVSAQIPTMGGFKMCRRIRAIVSIKGLPVLMLVSPGSFVEARFTGVEAGADKVAVRAPEIEWISDVMHELVRKSKGEKQPGSRW